MSQIRALNPSKLAAVGLVAGMVGGGLGLGGGFIMVPLLLALGSDRHRAHATSLAAIILIGVAGAISFGVAGEIDLLLGVQVGLGGIAGSALGAVVMNRVTARTLRVVFLVMLMLVSIRLLTGPVPTGIPTDLGDLAVFLIALAIGVVAGFAAGLAGVGGGMIIVPAVVFLLGLAQHEAQGTALVAIVFTAATATVINSRNGRVRLADGVWLGLAGAAGALVGTRIALAIDGPTLTRVFGVVMLAVAARSIYHELRALRAVIR